MQARTSNRLQVASDFLNVSGNVNGGREARNPDVRSTD